MGKQQVAEHRHPRRKGSQRAGDQTDTVTAQFPSDAEHQRRTQGSGQPVAPKRMPQRQKRRDPKARSGEVPAGEATFVQNVHLVEQSRHIGVAGEPQSAGQKRLGLKQIAVFIVVSGRKIAERSAHAPVHTQRQ